MWRAGLLILLLRSTVAERTLIPVFMIDTEKTLSHLTIEANPFSKMASSDFSDIVEEAAKRAKVVIIFVEENFCVEYVSVKDAQGTPFYHLGQVLREKGAKYLPSVHKPLDSLKNILQPNSGNVFQLSDSSSKLDIYDKMLKYFYINFKDKFNETRACALRRHDLMIKELYYVVRQITGGPVVAFYTGKINPTGVDTVYLSAKSSQQQSPGVLVNSHAALFKLIGVYGTTGTRRSTYNQVPLISNEDWQQHGLTTRMAYSDFELEFNFKFNDERWTIEKVLLLELGEEVGRTDVRVGARWGNSYMCSDPIVLINMRDGSALTISHYQIQPFNMYKELALTRSDNGTKHTISGNSTNQNQNPSRTYSRQFGPPVHCGPYFTAHILAGLMVSAFCLSILVYGVVSMYSINANDRYDDAQQKPLVIAFEAGH